MIPAKNREMFWISIFTLGYPDADLFHTNRKFLWWLLQPCQHHFQTLLQLLHFPLRTCDQILWSHLDNYILDIDISSIFSLQIQWIQVFPFYFVLYFTLHDGQYHETDSPCSLNIIPPHFGHGLISSLTILLKN